MSKATLNRRTKVGQPGSRQPGSKRASLSSPGGRPAAVFSERKSITELAAEQGVRLEGQLERIIGAGADLWASDKEFAEFVQGMYDRRREGLSLGKQ